MSTIEIEKNEFVTLWYHPEKKIVHHQCHKFVHGEPFKAFLLKGVETMKKYGADKWLSDDRQNSILKSEDIAWGQENWFPETQKTGWKYWAMVQPEGTIAKLRIEEMVEIYAKAGIVAKYFSDPDEALKWLESLP